MMIPKGAQNPVRQRMMLMDWYYRPDPNRGTC